MLELSGGEASQMELGRHEDKLLNFASSLVDFWRP